MIIFAQIPKHFQKNDHPILKSYELSEIENGVMKIFI
jgi:hypothetical protein